MKVSTIEVTAEHLLFEDLRSENNELFTSCFYNVMYHVDRNLKRSINNHDRTAKLLAMRWLLKKELVNE